MTAAALLTSAWSHWTTPDNVLERVRRLGPIGLDPCGNPEDHVQAALSWHGPHAKDVEHRGDGLQEGWLGYGLVFCMIIRLTPIVSKGSV